MKNLFLIATLAGFSICVLGCRSAADAPQVQLERARVLLDRNQPNEAIEILDGLATTLPEDPEVFYLRGLAYEQLGNSESALKDFTESLHISPDQAACLNDRAVLLARLEKYEPAVVDLQHLVDLYPGDASAWINFGLIWHKRKEFAKADNAYARAAAIAPDAELFFLRGCLSFEQQKFEEGETYFSKAITANEKMVKAWLNRGVCRIYLQNGEGGVNDLRMARKLDEDLQFTAVIDVLLRSAERYATVPRQDP
jgi:tetratricopeptide (TPR) repeat protein